MNIMTAAYAAQETPTKYTYTPSDVSGLCKWQTDDPRKRAQRWSFATANTVPSTENPTTDQLSLYIRALQDERTNAGTKASTLKKLGQLTEDQRKALISSDNAREAFCDNEELYPNPHYYEPLALTLFLPSAII